MFDHVSIPLIIVSFIALLFSLSVHEAAHAATAYWLEDDTAARQGRMSLNPIAHIDWIGTVAFPLLGMFSGLPFIGWAKPVPIQPQRFTRRYSMRTGVALVSAAGPASNLLLCMIALVVTALIVRFTTPEIPKELLLKVALRNPGALLQLQQTGTGTVFILVLFGEMVLMNIGLALFNLLPLGPLDGAGVLQGFLPYRAAQAFDRFRPYMYYVLLGLVFTGVLRFVLGPLFDLLGRALYLIGLIILGV